MLGWWITISTASPEELDSLSSDKTATLAHWEVGVDGIDWLDQLVRQGKAQRLENLSPTYVLGYPIRWQAQAGVILPLLAEGRIHTAKNNGPLIFGLDEGEEYVRPFHWIDTITQHPDRIAACTPEQRLTIDAWDLS